MLGFAAGTWSTVKEENGFTRWFTILLEIYLMTICSGKVPCMKRFRFAKEIKKHYGFHMVSDYHIIVKPCRLGNIKKIKRNQLDKKI